MSRFVRARHLSGSTLAACTDLPSHVTTSSNTQILPKPSVVKFQSTKNPNVTFYRGHQWLPESILLMTMMSTFVSPPGLIGCDDVELGKPYNLTVLHSYNCTLCHTVTLLHIYIPINTFALSNYNTVTVFLHLQPHSFTVEIQIEQE